VEGLQGERSLFRLGDAAIPEAGDAARRAEVSHAPPASSMNVSREGDVAPVEELSCDDVVLEVDPAGGSLEATGAAARNDRVLAASVNLRASRHVWIPLGRECVRRGKRPLGPAIEAPDENLFTALLVHAARASVVSCGHDLRVPATLQASRHHERRDAREVLIPGGWVRALTCGVEDPNPRDLTRRRARGRGKRHHQANGQNEEARQSIRS
jgi:hypothetical protein